MPTKRHLKLVAPTNQDRSVATPTKPGNGELRTREYLTQAEVTKLIAATRHSRYPQRDATLILVVYRHGLRAAEACDLEWLPLAPRPYALPRPFALIVGLTATPWKDSDPFKKIF